ncbi:hypothetical protein OAK19_06710 [Aureispira]|nr:hypothetical protein [Aureispira sp.]
MPELLDDNIDFKPKVPKPDSRIALVSLSVFMILLVLQFKYIGSSETELMEGSYIWMPFLVTGISGILITPKSAITLGLLTLPTTYIFYETIWHGL